MLVTKLTAVLRAISHGMPARPRLNGNAACAVRMIIRTTIETAEKASTATR